MRISDWSSDVCSSDLGNQRVETKRKSREHRDLWNSNGSTFKSACPQMQVQERRIGRNEFALCIDHSLDCYVAHWQRVHFVFRPGHPWPYSMPTLSRSGCCRTTAAESLVAFPGVSMPHDRKNDV